MLQLDQLTKTFGAGNTAVDRVSLSLAQGEILCLLGPSGCGKTTLLRLIAGLEQPDIGRIVYDGREVAQTPPHKRGFGMMFQDYALFPHKNVFDNIAFGLEMRGDSHASIQKRVREMLELVALDRFELREIDRLSGGEQQRVALARALAPGPELLLLDEPLGALDRALRERLMIDLRTILKRVGVTAVYVTHDQTEALAIGDLVAVMNNGRIEQIAPPKEIFDRPNSSFVARFLGFHNIVDGTATADGMIRTPIGTLSFSRLSVSTGESLQLLIKPTGARFTRTAVDGAIQVKVQHVGFYGRYFQMTVSPLGIKKDASEGALVFELSEIDGYLPDDLLYMSIESSHIHLF